MGCEIVKQKGPTMTELERDLHICEYMTDAQFDQAHSVSKRRSEAASKKAR